MPIQLSGTNHKSELLLNKQGTIMLGESSTVSQENQNSPDRFISTFPAVRPASGTFTGGRLDSGKKRYVIADILSFFVYTAD